MTHNTDPSTWIMSHLRGAEKLAREDAETSERLARQVKASIGSDREPGRCYRCGRAKPRASTLAACENCRERDAREKRSRILSEDAKERAERLEKRRAVEKERRDRLKAAGVRKEADRKAALRRQEKEERARQRAAQTALRRLEARGIVLKGTGT